jgi:hypothetical protein
MKKLLLSTILLIFTFGTFAQNCDSSKLLIIKPIGTFDNSPYDTDSSDLVMVKSKDCYVYKTPQTIYNEIAKVDLETITTK